MVYFCLFHTVTVGSFFFPRRRPLSVVGIVYHEQREHLAPLTLHTGDGSDFHYLNREFDDSVGETRLAGILLDENPYSFC